MPVRTLPTQFTAIRDLPPGVSAGDVLTAAAAAAAYGHKALEDLVSRGLLAPDEPLYVQTARRSVPGRSIQPWSISPTEFLDLLSS